MVGHQGCGHKRRAHHDGRNDEIQHREQEVHPRLIQEHARRQPSQERRRRVLKHRRKQAQHDPLDHGPEQQTAHQERPAAKEFQVRGERERNRHQPVGEGKAIADGVRDLEHGADEHDQGERDPINEGRHQQARRADEIEQGPALGLRPLAEGLDESLDLVGDQLERPNAGDHGVDAIHKIRNQTRQTEIDAQDRPPHQKIPDRVAPLPAGLRHVELGGHDPNGHGDREQHRRDEREDKLPDVPRGLVDRLRIEVRDELRDAGHRIAPWPSAW